MEKSAPKLQFLLHRKQKLLSLFDKKDPCFVCNVPFSNSGININDNILEKFCYLSSHYLGLDLEKFGSEQSSSLLILPLTTSSLTLADYLKIDSKSLDSFSGHLDQKICGGCLPAVKSFCDIYERVNKFNNDDHGHDQATLLIVNKEKLNDVATKIAELMKMTIATATAESNSKNGEFYGITSDNLRERLKKRGALRRDNFRKQFISKTGMKLDPEEDNVTPTPIQVPDESIVKVEDPEPSASNAKDGNLEPLLIEEFACRHCGKKFRFGKQRRNHERIHTEFKPFKCSFCGKQFTQQQYLTTHQRTHTGEKPYKCSLCSEGFTRRNGWKRHNVKAHNGEGNVIMKYNDDNDDKSRPWKCTICGRGHFDKHLLRLHQRMHRNKPFACHVCGKEFIRLKNCKMHLETTHGQNREELQKVHVQGLIKVNENAKSDLSSCNSKSRAKSTTTTVSSSFNDNEIGKVEVKQEIIEPEAGQDDHQVADVTATFLVPASLVKVEVKDLKIENEDYFILPH